jgi:hypothetical protein
MPEGAMVNYLARRASPVPYLVFGPHELQILGEDRVTAALTAHPPAYVLLWHQQSPFDVGYFGADERYGLSVMRWAKSNYTSVWLLGQPPLQTNQFGLQLLRRQVSLPGAR